MRPLHRYDDDRVGVPGHRAGVAEGEVDVLVPVDVPHAIAVRAVEVDREGARFLVHPRHRHAAEEVLGVRVGGGGLRAGGHEGLLFAGGQGGEAAAVDADHGSVL